MAALDPYLATDAELAEALGGEPAYRVRQLRAWLARGVDDPAEMTDLPKRLRARLPTLLAPPPRLVAHTTADDGLTHKVLLEMPASGPGGAGGERIESVLMRYPADTSRERARATVCVSTQAGCAMGCPFCATGQAGLRGQLSAGEIVRQVTVMQRLLASGRVEAPGAPEEDRGDWPPGTHREDRGDWPPGTPRHVTGVVFMGMGEPLANAEATLAAVRWLTDPQRGLGLSARSITVSTIGLVPGMRRLAGLGLPVRLAVSLHAPDDALRDDLVPLNRTHPLAEVLAEADAYRRATGRRVTFEYVLIDGVNDAPSQAAALAALLRGTGPSHVNLIPMNPTPGVDWKAPPLARQRAFARVLDEAGLPVTIRANRGGDIDAACGQLYATYRLASGRTLPAAAAAAARLGLAPAAGASAVDAPGGRGP